MSTTQKLFYLDGNYYPIDQKEGIISLAANRIYEVLRVINGKLLFLRDHFERFSHSLDALAIQNPLALISIEEIIKTLLNRNNTEVCNIRFEAILQNNTISIAVYEVPAKYPDPILYAKGINTITYNIERANPHVKQSRINNQVRKELEALYQSSGAYEILMVNSEGYITEGSRSNVFFIKDGNLYSPPSDTLLEGITRKKVIEIAMKNGIAVIEEPISLTKTGTFDACFITGTSPKILPISTLDNHIYNTENKVLKGLITAYDKLIMHICTINSRY